MRMWVLTVDNVIAAAVAVRPINVGMTLEEFKRSRTVPSATDAEYCRLIVADRFRRRGYSNMLTEKALSFVKNSGFERIFLTATSAHDPHVQDTYKKLGWREIGRKPFLPMFLDNEGYIDYVKELK